jgi:HD-like signal output (HDOD) protein
MSKELNRDILVRLGKELTLPALSNVAVCLIELACDDNTSVGDLSDLIEKDPSLTVRVIQLANSAFFQTRYPVTTVKQAVLRMGFQQLRVLALTLSLKDTFPMGKVGPINYEQFWKVSLYRGILAKLLARQLGGCDEDEAFTAGLTLEIGFLIMVTLLGKEKDRTIDAGLYPLESLLSHEEDTHGFNHRQVGEIALGTWKFPEKIIECQRFYGKEGAGLDPPGLPGMCRMAGKLSALICYEQTDFHEVYQTVESVLLVGHEVINEVVVTALKEVDEVAEILKMDVRGEADMAGLVEKANKALGRLSQSILQPLVCGPADDLPSFETLRAGDPDTKQVTHTLQAVAHEIRNPLTAVGGFARRLASSVDPASKEWKYTEIILAETKRLEGILKDMLAYAQP